MKTLILLFSIILLSPALFFGQTKPSAGQPYACDGMLGLIDTVATSEFDKTNQFIIVVSVLGDGESMEISNQRLDALTYYLTNKRRIPKDKVVLTKAKSSRKGLGRVDFYIGGELRESLFFEKRGRLCTSCCPSEYRTK